MNDLPIVLAVIAIVLTIVTFVGHGIWVLLAAMFGGGGKKPSQTCPFCRRSTPARHDRCDWCSKDLASPVARELSDLEVVRRQLQRFRENGTLAPQVVDRLQGRLQNYRQQLLHPAAGKHAAPVVATVILEQAAPSRPAAAPTVLPTAVHGQARKPDVLNAPAVVRAAVPSVEAVRPSVPQVIAKPQAAPQAARGYPTEAKASPHLPPAEASRCGRADSRRETAAAGAAVAVLDRDVGRLHGTAEYSLGRTDRRIAVRLLVGRPGGQPVGNPGEDPLFRVLHLRLDLVGRLRRRALRPSSLEAGIDQPGLAGDCHALGALEFRRHGEHGEGGVDAPDPGQRSSFRWRSSPTWWAWRRGSSCRTADG